MLSLFHPMHTGAAQSRPLQALSTAPNSSSNDGGGSRRRDGSSHPPQAVVAGRRDAKDGGTAAAAAGGPAAVVEEGGVCPGDSVQSCRGGGGGGRGAAAAGLKRMHARKGTGKRINAMEWRVCLFERSMLSSPFFPFLGNTAPFTPTSNPALPLTRKARTRSRREKPAMLAFLFCLLPPPRRCQTIHAPPRPATAKLPQEDQEEMRNLNPTFPFPITTSALLIIIHHPQPALSPITSGFLT